MKRKALLVIDVQESFRQRANWSLLSNPDIVADVNRLVDHARSAGDLVVWLLHTEPGTGNVFDPAAGHVRLLDGLQPRDTEPVLTKTSHNAFTSTGLGRLLTAHGVTELVVCGIRTEQCCETTARVGSDLGYQVTFVLDATATQPIPAPGTPLDRDPAEIAADPATLSCDAILERTRYVLSGRFATVVTVDEVTNALTGS